MIYCIVHILHPIALAIERTPEDPTRPPRQLFTNNSLARKWGKDYHNRSPLPSHSRLLRYWMEPSRETALYIVTRSPKQFPCTCPPQCRGGRCRWSADTTDRPTSSSSSPPSGPRTWGPSGPAAAAGFPHPCTPVIRAEGRDNCVLKKNLQFKVGCGKR